MRKTLMFAALFATTLVTGSALAERPTEIVRNRGDVVDKVYRVSTPKEHASHEQSAARSTKAAPNKATEKAEPRWRCETDDCATGRTEARAAAADRKSAKADGEKIHEQRVQERVASRWNCAPDVETCRIDGAHSSTQAGRTPGSSKAAKGEVTRAEPQAKEKKDPGAAQMSPADAAKAQRMVQMIKAKICERMGGECGGDE